MTRDERGRRLATHTLAITTTILIFNASSILRSSDAFAFPDTSNRRINTGLLREKRRIVFSRPTICSSSPIRSCTTRLTSTSASSAYLDSLSYNIYPQDQTLLGATSKYLDTLSDHISRLNTWNAVQDVSSQSVVWTAEMLQQATEDLTQALTEMTSSDHNTADYFSHTSFLDYSNTLLATSSNVQNLWDVDIVDQKGRVVDSAVSSFSANAPSIFQKSSQDALADITNNLNNLVNQFTTKTTKAANAAANAANGIQAPTLNVPRYSSPPINNAFQGVSKAAGSVSSQLQDALQSTTQQLQDTMGAAKTALGASGKSAPPAFDTKISATQFAATQGFSQDVQGVIEMIVATVVSIPRALMDQAMLDYAPNALEDMMRDWQLGFVVPLTRPLQEFATQEPLQQVQSLFQVLQLLLAVMVAVPRAILESLTGVTASEYLAGVQQLNVSDLTKAFLSFAGAVIAAVATLLKFVLNITSAVLGVAAAGAVTPESVLVASNGEHVLTKIANILADDLLPSVADGLGLLIHRYVEMMVQSGVGL